MNPCKDFCYLVHGRQYTPECDEKCDYAKEVKQRRDLEATVEKITNALAEYYLTKESE